MDPEPAVRAHIHRWQTALMALQARIHDGISVITTLLGLAALRASPILTERPDDA
ncbi:MAG: hypothetical protein ABUL62_14960 [Myxococcales bacterium]|jgi:hypothetical protein